MRQRLLVVTMFYRPERNLITADVAESLAADFEVTVITAHPNYPLGRFFEGVHAPWWPQRRQEGEISVWRLPIIPYHGLSKILRAIHYGSFTIWATLLAPFVGGHPDVVWVYQTPFTNALAALWFKWVYRARLVYTSADLWPEAMLASRVAQHGPLIRLLFAYSRWINRAADRIIASTRGMTSRYMNDGYPSDRIEYVPVWVEGADAAPAPLPSALGKPAIVYCGNLGPAQRIDTLVRAAAQLNRDGVDVTIDLYGYGAEESSLRALAAELGATNVSFHGRVTPAEAFAASSQALAQIVSLQPSPLFAMTVPSKLAFCFAAGSPVLAGMQGEGATLASASGCSIDFDPEDPLSLVTAITRLLALNPEERAAMSARARAFYESNFAKSRLLERYRDILGSEAAAARPR